MLSGADLLITGAKAKEGGGGGKDIYKFIPE